MDQPSTAYLKWYYDNHVWKKVLYRGVRTLKSVSDMWNYQEIFHEHNIHWVIETGTRHGGSALFFADRLALIGASGFVISIDYAPELPKGIEKHPKLLFLKGDSTTPQMIDKVKSYLPPVESRKPLFLILDSDHAYQHVLKELYSYVPLLQKGDYLVVEDTCINGHPVRPDFGPGPWEAIDEFVKHNPNVLIHDKEREEKFGFTFAPRGFYIKS